MTAESDALAKWHEEKEVYQAWGDALTDKVLQGLAADDEISIEKFLKIPAKPRLKEDDSFLTKVRRKIAKGESMDTIDDRVGVRFVVLLTEQISVIEELIRSFGYTVSKDRDYEAEREKEPMIFTYQSVHLVVRPREDETHGSITVPAGTACEIQIRTLLQHAHSELTHDRVYKSRRDPPRGLYRSVARSMALIEATDDIFDDVALKLDQAEAKVRSVARNLDAIYRERIDAEPEAERYNAEFIEDLLECGFDEDLDSISSRIESMIDTKPYIATKIKENRLNQPLMYGISGVLFAYLLTLESLDRLKIHWPLDYKYLEDICLDVGICID